MKTVVFIEKNLIFSWTQFLHYAVFNVRVPRDVELFYITKLELICQQLFSSFLTFVFSLGAVVSDSFYILPNHSSFVNGFSYIFYIFSSYSTIPDISPFTPRIRSKPPVYSPHKFEKLSLSYNHVDPFKGGFPWLSLSSVHSFYILPSCFLFALWEKGNYPKWIPFKW